MLFPDQDSSSAFAMSPGPVRDRERSIDRRGGRRGVADRYRSDFSIRGWVRKNKGKENRESNDRGENKSLPDFK